ncbi:MAG: hypothetical protein NXI23_17265 [Bacteroidetes bacterium]|jgi:hypothetical protein|nr:hypothetical protein [Bacteroidota bacterium]MDF1865780.1 hypothetical protein [Saprospiraceae bacterium]
MKKYFYWYSWVVTFMAVFVPTCSFSQENNISGLWVGYNTQESDGSYSSKYKFEIYINQKDSVVIGRTYATVGSIFAEMELVGKLIDGKYLQFQETKVIDFKAEDGMEWCIKTGILTLTKIENQWHLRGSWKGTTSFSDCIPGKVFLNKVEPRA